MRPRAEYAVLAIVLACADPILPRGGIPTLDDRGADGFSTISAGKEHSCALTVDGTAFCWGSNEFGQLGTASDDAKCFREDRPIACRRAPRPVNTTLVFKRIAAGGSHTCGLGNDDRVYCWGDNLHGAIGDPNVRTAPTPTAVLTSERFVDVVAGGSHSCALRGDGAAFCWGENTDGQLGLAVVGNGTTVPTQAQTSQRFASLAAGQRRTCARVPDGTTYCWGATWVQRRNTTEVTRSQGSPSRVLGAMGS